MRLKRNLAGLLAVFAVLMLATPQASAHVLVTDQASRSSAVLHITPDDDPEAGKPAEFYYELQTSVSYTTFDEYRLYITDEDDAVTQVPVNTTSQSISAEYTFPTQGLYRLELKSINPWKTSFDLRYSLRVSRGAVGGASQAQKYAWAQPLLIATGVGFGLLAILFINSFRSIRQRSVM